MIITRTPYRISFFGGGTDFPDYYQEKEGKVISVTINKFCYINCRLLPTFFNYKSRLRYYKNEEVESNNLIKHPSIKSCLKHMNIEDGIEIVHSGDLPARSGIGSSSSFTVGLLNALHALKGEKKTKRELAIEAIEVEQNIIKEIVGSQDQVAASFGGLNKITFTKPGNFLVEPLRMKQQYFNNLENHLLLFFTGLQRNSSDLSIDHVKLIDKNILCLDQMVELVDQAETLLYKGDIKNFGKLLNEQWNLKKSLTKRITNDEVDKVYELGMSSGAYGGKLLGAGSGGFLMFVAPPEIHNKIKLNLCKYLEIPIKLDNLGSQVIYFTRGNY